MKTAADYLQAGDLVDASGNINVGSSVSIAGILNSGGGLVGRAGLDLPGFTFKKLADLPTFQDESGRIVKTGDAFQSNPGGVGSPLLKPGYSLAPGNDSRFQDAPLANIEDIFSAAGVAATKIRDYIRNLFYTDNYATPVGAYIPDATYNSLLNDLSGINAAEDRAFNKKAVAAFATVLTAGAAYNAYGAAAAGEGATAAGAGDGAYSFGASEGAATEAGGTWGVSETVSNPGIWETVKGYIADNAITTGVKTALQLGLAQKSADRAAKLASDRANKAEADTGAWNDWVNSLLAPAALDNRASLNPAATNAGMIPDDTGPVKKFLYAGAAILGAVLLIGILKGANTHG